MNYPTRTYRSPGRPPSYAARVFPTLPLPREAPLSAGQALGLFLFALVNVLLFVRPAELFPELSFIPTYEYLIIACLVVSSPFVYRQLSQESLRNSPISVCVLGLQIAVVLSQLLSPLHFFSLWWARDSAFKFFKILVYFFLLVGLVTTPRRLRRFLVVLAVLIFILIGVDLLHYYGVISIPALWYLQIAQVNEQTGAAEFTIRLQSLGIFNDPNDLAMILVVGMAICLYLCGYRRTGVLGLLWLLPVGVFGYGLYLTRSRGGFLAMLMGLLVLFHAKYGLLRTLLLSVVVLPIMFVLFQGRQTELSSNEETAVTRLQLWSMGFTFFKQAPFFGNGLDQFQEDIGAEFVPHNTYVHCFAELGFFGGMFLVGAFYYALRGLYRSGARDVYILDPEQRRLRPYILALTAGYAVNMLTLSRLVHQPTYLVLGLAMIYLRVTPIYPPQRDLRMSWRLLGRFALVSVVFMTLMYVYVRLNVQWR